jgi:hypothetical protein
MLGNVALLAILLVLMNIVTDLFGMKVEVLGRNVDKTNQFSASSVSS